MRVDTGELSAFLRGHGFQIADVAARQNPFWRVECEARGPHFAVRVISDPSTAWIDLGAPPFIEAEWYDVPLICEHFGYRPAEPADSCYDRNFELLISYWPQIVERFRPGRWGWCRVRNSLWKLRSARTRRRHA
jgi:hypothetical protein